MQAAIQTPSSPRYICVTIIGTTHVRQVSKMFSFSYKQTMEGSTAGEERHTCIINCYVHNWVYRLPLVELTHCCNQTDVQLLGRSHVIYMQYNQLTKWNESYISMTCIWHQFISRILRFATNSSTKKNQFQNFIHPP